MDYLEIANSPVLYIGVAALIAVVVWQASVYISRTLKRAKELGIGSEKLKKAAKVAVLTSIVPSIAIVVALLTLVPVLGLPVSWGRLSIIGSLSYELLAAKLGAEAASVSLGGAGYDATAFLTSVTTMTIGSFVTLGLTIFGFKWYKNRLNKSIGSSKADNPWGRILMAALIVSLYSRFLAEPVVEGGSAFITMVSSAAVMFLLDLLVKHSKAFKWLGDFNLSISMISGMAVAVLAGI
ncbi:MAG: DUF5058 family protein [Sphaerochaetaceae bacterium]|jgi:hypothetical protein|nr:DUF5058 family protein [Sphaerochaetaceae bacterium]